MGNGDALSDLSAAERAQIEAMVAERRAGDARAESPSGLIRRGIRLQLRLACLAIAGALAWYLGALALLPEAANGALRAPLPLTIGLALAAVVFLLWFDGVWRRILLLLLGLAFAAAGALSMRWVDSAQAGVREHWAGYERSVVRIGEPRCYRIDARTLAIRGTGQRVFVYERWIWPASSSEAEFRAYFFSDAPMEARADGWTCVARS